MAAVFITIIPLSSGGWMIAAAPVIQPMPINIVGAVYIIGLAEKGRGKKAGRPRNHKFPLLPLP
jgi:hypothetical protein